MSRCSCPESLEEQVQHFTPLIRKIGRARTFEKKKQLFHSGPSECLTKFLSECSGALLRQDIRLPSYKKIKKFKKELLYLANPEKSIKIKSKKFASKKGGFLQLLAILGNILASTVIPLIVDKFRKK